MLLWILIVVAALWAARRIFFAYPIAAARSWRRSLTDDERAALVAREAEIEAAFDGVE